MVDQLNHKLLQKLTDTPEMTFLSIHITVDQDQANQYPVEFLNTLKLTGMPPHNLTLKLDALIILRRNLDPSHLCNETRLIVTSMKPHVLQSTIITDVPFEFKRLQFPVKLSFGISVNKSQGQSLKIDYDYQGDSPKEEDTSSSQEACPSVPKTFSQSACQQSQCKTDQDCNNNKHKRCCFNGCIYTCTQPIDEPALIDWRVAPRRIVKSAPYWLIRDPETPEQYQSCSTSKVLDDGDPLLCPDGYVCHIVTPENHEQNIPNRGWCVKEKDDRNHSKYMTN
eukprot:XP_014778757.1 PREDICTED: WAP four-disulfide core domain protein 1-like [Octopus bimaculoides]